jgi:hypothetical protein
MQQQFPKGPYAVTLRGQWVATAVEERLAVELGYDEHTTLAVESWRKGLSVAVYDHDAKKWSTKAERGGDPVPDQPFVLRIEVDAAELRVSATGADPLAWQHGGRELRTRCGVRVQGVMWLDGLTIAPLEPSKK